jgi:hypothetical protein
MEREFMMTFLRGLLAGRHRKRQAKASRGDFRGISALLGAQHRHAARNAVAA